MSVQQLITAEQFWAMPEVPGKRLELVNGEVVETLPLTVQQGLIVGNVYRALREFAERDDLGLVFMSGLGYVLGRGPDSVRMTHASFIPWEFVPKEGVPDWFWEGPPLIAVQVVGPYDRDIELQGKVSQFLNAETQHVWILWPRRREITVRSADGMSRALRPDEDLDGGEMLPGFRVCVAGLFELPIRPEVP